MRADRLGSYSIVATRPGTPYFSRLKSMRRSFCLCPPPWWRMVRSPVLRRPPVRCLTVRSGLYGLSVVRSSFTCVVLKRRVGVIGLYVLIAIVFVLESRPKLRSASHVFSGTCLSCRSRYFFSAELPLTTVPTGCSRTPAASGRPSAGRKPSSNPDGSPRTSRGDVPCQPHWQCEQRLPSP